MKTNAATAAQSRLSKQRSSLCGFLPGALFTGAVSTIEIQTNRPREIQHEDRAVLAGY